MHPRTLPADAWRLWLVLFVVIGALVRLSSVIGGDFPVGDGGFIAASIEDIRGAGFALPLMASYNGGEIPFAYPPLAMYLGAALPLPPLVTLQWLPALLATATIIPAFLIARRVRGTTAGLAAAGFLALAPFAWLWLVQGGGLTRSLALLLGLFAIAAAMSHRGILTGVLGGLTALAHPETAIFAAIVAAAVLAFDRAWRPLVVAGLVSAVVAAPWLALIVGRHGLDPLLAAVGARSVNPVAAVLSISGDRPGALDLAAPLGLIGLVASGVAWLWVAAAAVGLVLTTSIASHLAPLMAVGTGVTVATRHVSRPVLVGAAALLVLGSAVTTGNPQRLGADDRDAMSWIADQTPTDARFAVLSDETWSRADEAEWFPYLTGRVSVTTMQGREWLPDWQAIERSTRELAHCTDAACIDTWAVKHDVDYLYLADDCCPRLDAVLGARGRYGDFGTAQLVAIGGG